MPPRSFIEAELSDDPFLTIEEIKERWEEIKTEMNEHFEEIQKFQGHESFEELMQEM